MLVKVFASRDTFAVHFPQGGGKLGATRLGSQPRHQIPVFSSRKTHPVAFPVDDHAGRHRLHSSGRQAGTNLAPQQGGDFVADQAVENTAGLLGVDQVSVQLAGMAQGVVDSVFGNLVKHHAFHGDFRFQHLHQVPGNSLPLAVLISGQQEFVGLFQPGFQLADFLFLIPVNHVIWLEVVIQVNRELRVASLFQRGRKVRRLSEVTNVTHRCLHIEVVTEEPPNGSSFRRRLDNHEFLVFFSH